MTPDAVANVVAWISEAGLAATDETGFLAALCTQARAAGLTLSRATVFVDALHPIYEGRVFRWHDGPGAIPAADYGRTEGENLERWQQSPFFHVIETGQTKLRVPVTADSIARFPITGEMLGEGATEYVACITRFGTDDVIGGLDCVYSGWATASPGGFTSNEVKAIMQLLPPLAMVLKSRALTRVARTLAIFSAASQADACRAALRAAERAIAEVAALGRRRAEAGLPHTSLYLGLHVGDVFFSNIGSRDRLDFTVVRPAVNEVSRIAAMCHSLDQPVLISSAFADGLGESAERLVSVGRYALRGVGGAQHLFTLDPVGRMW
jgi:hypothetical protein